MKTIKQWPSPNFSERTLPICGIVIHYTEEELPNTLKIFGDDKRAKRVSSHYVIDREGMVYQIVPEAKRAWHAGNGSWAGITDVNSASIGIELVCLPGEKYAKRQIDSLMALCLAIQSRHDIKWVIGHSDCAFSRGKVDPGELFPWKKLAKAGIGIWPDGLPHKSSLGTRELLEGIGYDTIDEHAALNAFILHFCPRAKPGSSTVRRCLEAVYVAATASPVQSIKKGGGDSGKVASDQSGAGNLARTSTGVVDLATGHVGACPAYGMGELATKVRVSRRQRAWFTARYERKASLLEKNGQKKRKTREQFWKYVGIDGEKEIKRHTTILFGDKGNPRKCDRDVLEKSLAWTESSFDDFLKADNAVPTEAMPADGTCKQNQTTDFFSLAEKSLRDALAKNDKERIDDVLHLIDAVIFTQPHFSARQLKSIIFSIGGFLHMCRDRALPLVSASQEGYGYGWFRLWLWMKRIVSVLRKTVGQPERDAETGTRMGLFIPWCESICVKMLRHKLFMKNVQRAPARLISEIRTTIRHSFLLSLCDGAEYYLSLFADRRAADKSAIDELVAIRKSISGLNEANCREKALRIMEMLKCPLESASLATIRKLARSERLKGMDILQARIVLGQIMENWGHYLCYSSDSGDQTLLEALIASAELAAWSTEIETICRDIIHDGEHANGIEASYGIEYQLEDYPALSTLPIEREFIHRLLSLASDILFLKARQMDAWKWRDRRLSIRKVLQSACSTGMVLCKFVEKQRQKMRDASLVEEKFHGDLARKTGYYARYWFDERDYFKQCGKSQQWLKFDDAMTLVRALDKDLNLHLPWLPDADAKRSDILDKLYWNFEMELWVEYDLRVSSFASQKKISPQNRERIAKELKEWGGWGASLDNISAYGGWRDPFEAFAEIVMLYSEMTWGGYPASDHSARAMVACRKWAAGKLHCGFHEPRKTKMNPAELLKLAMGTFLRFRNNPNGEADKYSYQDHGEETSFVEWVSAVLDSQTSQHQWADIEAVRTFTEIVFSDFLYLRSYIACNSKDYKDEERFYLKKTLRRRGEVPYPWDCEKEIWQCARKLGCAIAPPGTPPKLSEQEPSSKICITAITSDGYVKLCNWIRSWRGDLAQDKDIAFELDISRQCLSYVRAEERVGKVSLQKRQAIIEHASDILGVEYSEILEEISVGGMHGGRGIVSDSFDFDTLDVDKRLERFVRALRNTSMGVKVKLGFVENMDLYERGLSRYFANLGAGENSKRKTSILFHEWKMAKYSGKKFFAEIREKMKQPGDFYDMPTVERWFAHTLFSGAGDAVNILKLGFVGLEFLSANPERKIGQEPLRNIVMRCGTQLAAAKPDWDGTKVLKEKTTALVERKPTTVTAKNFTR